MRIITANKRMAVMLISMFAVIALVACGGESEPTAVAQAPTTVLPTATQIVVEVTVAPIPTETPAPTPTVEPIPEPTVVLTDEISADFLAETKAQPVREFPASISKGATEMSSEEALAVWDELLIGSRTVGVGETSILEYCADGAGTWIWELGTPSQTNQPFDWALSSDPGGSWRTAIVTIKIHDKKIFDLLNYAGGDGWRLGLAEPNKYVDWQIYEAPACGPATSSGESFTGEMVNNDSVVGVTNYPEGHALAGQDPELANTLSVEIEGTIESSHLGSGTVAGAVTIDLTGLYTGGCTAILEGSEGTISFTAEDGDVLNMVMTTNQLCGATGEFTGVYDIVGGTGKFESAEGEITASSFPVEGEPSVNTLTGTIDY